MDARGLCVFMLIAALARAAGKAISVDKAPDVTETNDAAISVDKAPDVTETKDAAISVDEAPDVAEWKDAIIFEYEKNEESDLKHSHPTLEELSKIQATIRQRSGAVQARALTGKAMARQRRGTWRHFYVRVYHGGNYYWISYWIYV